MIIVLLFSGMLHIELFISLFKTLWNHQMKLVSQTRTAQGERFKAMKLLHEQYCKRSVYDFKLC